MFMFLLIFNNFRNFSTKWIQSDLIRIIITDYMVAKRHSPTVKYLRKYVVWLRQWIYIRYYPLIPQFLRFFYRTQSTLITFTERYEDVIVKFQSCSIVKQRIKCSECLSFYIHLYFWFNWQYAQYSCIEPTKSSFQSIGCFFSCIIHSWYHCHSKWTYQSNDVWLHCWFNSYYWLDM